MRQYGVHSIFGPTLQGEGPYSGIACIFIRFSGCNMWDGRPETRADSQCPYCDTDFFSHTMMAGQEIVAEIERLDSNRATQWVWISGGEPLLQLDKPLTDRLHAWGYKVAVETNGTVRPRPGTRLGIDLLTMSPKAPVEGIVLRSVDVLKVLYPHPNPAITPAAYDKAVVARWRYIQPIEDDQSVQNTQTNLEAAIRAVYAHSGWQLGLQIHKMLGVE